MPMGVGYGGKGKMAGPSLSGSGSRGAMAARMAMERLFPGGGLGDGASDAVTRRYSNDDWLYETDNGTLSDGRTQTDRLTGLRRSFYLSDGERPVPSTTDYYRFNRGERQAMSKSAGAMAWKRASMGLPAQPAARPQRRANPR